MRIKLNLTQREKNEIKLLKPKVMPNINDMINMVNKHISFLTPQYLVGTLKMSIQKYMS